MDKVYATNLDILPVDSEVFDHKDCFFDCLSNYIYPKLSKTK